MMDWYEISRRLRNGTSVQVLADLEGTTYKTMYNRIKYYERRDGKQYMKPEHLRKEKKAKVKEEAPEAAPVIVTNDYSCKGCAHCIQTSFNLFCELGHECGDNCVCSDYKTFPEPAQEEKPEFLQKKMNLPEVVPDKAPDIPEDVINECLRVAIQEQADALRLLHNAEDEYNKCQRYELKCRAIVTGLKKLLGGGSDGQ